MNKNINDQKNYFLYGLHTVLAVLRFQTNRCKKLFVARKTGAESLVNAAKKSSVSVHFVDRLFLNKKFQVGSEAQGVVLECRPFSYCSLEDLLHKNVKTLLVLDSLQDAANLGRAARAALCFSADGLVICKDRSAQVNQSAEKSAVGAFSQIPVARVVNLHSSLKKIKAAGFFVYGAYLESQLSIHDCQFTERSAIVIGREGEGLRRLTKETCDALVSIPMANESICLNAADTALLFLYELNIQNKKTGS